MASGEAILGGGGLQVDIGNNNFSKATSKHYYDPLTNGQNTPSPRPRTAPASRALFRNNRVIYTMKIRLPDTNDIMKSMQNTLKEWFKVMKEFPPNLVVYVWKTNTFDRAITNDRDITTNLFNMRDFSMKSTLEKELRTCGQTYNLDLMTQKTN